MQEGFSISHILKESWNITKTNLRDLILVFFVGYALIYIIASIVLGAIFMSLLGDEQTARSIATFFVSIINIALIIGVYRYYLLTVRGEKRDWKSYLRLIDFNRFLNTVAVSLVVSVLVFVGFIFLVVPGIYIAMRLAFAQWFVFDKGMGAIDAIKASWKLSEGLVLKLFLFYLATFLVALAGLIATVFTLGLGIFVLAPYLTVVGAYVYDYVLKIKGA